MPAALERSVSRRCAGKDPRDASGKEDRLPKPSEERRPSWLPHHRPSCCLFWHSRWNSWCLRFPGLGSSNLCWLPSSGVTCYYPSPRWRFEQDCLGLAHPDPAGEDQRIGDVGTWRFRLRSAPRNRPVWPLYPCPVSLRVTNDWGWAPRPRRARRISSSDGWPFQESRRFPDSWRPGWPSGGPPRPGRGWS